MMARTKATRNLPKAEKLMKPIPLFPEERHNFNFEGTKHLLKKNGRIPLEHFPEVEYYGPVDKDRNNQIKNIAYFLWLKNRKIYGQEERFWNEAESSVIAWESEMRGMENSISVPN